MFRVRRLAAAALIACAATSASAADFDLRPHFEAGQTLRYLSRSTIEISTRVDAADLDARVTITTESMQSFTVKDADSSGLVHVAWTTEHLVLKTDGTLPALSGPLDYDSRDANRGKSPLAPIFDPLVGKPIDVAIDADGKVVKVAEPATGATTGPLAGVAQALFMSREALTQLPIFVTDGAPNPARIRSAWSRSTKTAMPFGGMSLDIEQKFSIPRISPRRNLAYIHMTARVGGGEGDEYPLPCPTPNDCAPKTGPLTIRSSDGVGNYTWDHGRGSLIDGETALRLQATLTNPLGPMDVDLHMSASIRRIDRKPLAPKSTEKPTRPKPSPSPSPTPP